MAAHQYGQDRGSIASLGALEPFSQFLVGLFLDLDAPVFQHMRRRQSEGIKMPTLVSMISLQALESASETLC
jgi:hypothetical protein